ncbi:bifunctional pyr operon transcriptional regulator/uracil phosphoribosyltransferase PyrR [Undibacterium oligocarboniphilum]|uniref:Bifunctional pyr operon transcriptional regulator/uracil phosphoribosyltransferase PyrR n=1 Tax=Undibacterium oligocarboniphilum TaxID=666702 RepID=A0A850QN75_9BURK|nr:bifunctional pyr operon transcriptional regulator/uracil phosphoribosyltransferase PyrR [Undibacterium oligocarboniphilum]MBC3869910.1 bifunctional pyr operon transcriptional regulator/uracil phosphoribosyltransferase PyrR [Undibacterium oligocarboniphilum]NVO77526.1 bifunctional pyr operon transcriptional regulator/uracil phosphoribosyltransferase PyrR [Undibacterium oligocarboniphilum]
MTTVSTPLDAEVLYKQLLQQIKPLAATNDQLAIIGIYSGGAWIAERLVNDLGLKNKPGLIDVSFYRDDYAARGLHADVKSTYIPFAVDDAQIILVDDVLYTGRTTRAAINELFDYGRPARVMLAALVDRGGRQLPIAADFVAHVAAFEPAVSVNLQRAEDGTLSFSIDHV